MTHEHVHHTVEDRGMGMGLVLGAVLALLIVVVAAFFYFGGFTAGTNENSGTSGGGAEGAGAGESAPSSYQYVVPDYQLVVR